MTNDFIVLRHQIEDGTPLTAIFVPEKGMNLVSFKWGAIELIASSDLGTIIGPHYGDRHSGTLPILPDAKTWPQSNQLNAEGHVDPFYHGVGRYAPWDIQSDGTNIKAKLIGKQEWQGIALSKLEGQNFTMGFTASLTSKGLTIEISVVSDSDSLVGFDYNLRLPKGAAIVSSDVKDYYLEGKDNKTIPSTWNYDTNRRLKLDASHPANFTFYPFKDSLQGDLLLETTEYHLALQYKSQSQENCWQLIHLPGASHICIRPLSAKLPHRPSLTVSSLSMSLCPAFNRL